MSLAAFRPDSSDLVPQIAHTAIYCGVPGPDSRSTPQLKAASVFLKEVERTGNAPTEFQFAAYARTPQQRQDLVFLEKAGPIDVADSHGNTYNVQFRPVIFCEESNAMLPSNTSGNASVRTINERGAKSLETPELLEVSGAERLRMLALVCKKEEIPLWVETADEAALAVTEQRYEGVTHPNFGELFLANLPPDTVPVFGKELLPKAVLEKAGVVHQVFSACFLTGKAVCATVLLALLTVCDIIVSPFLYFSEGSQELAWSVAPHFLKDLNNIWSYNQMPEASVNREALAAHQVTFGPQTVLDEPDYDVVATADSLEAFSKAADALLEIEQLQDAEYNEACAYLQNPRGAPKEPLRGFLLNVANQFGTLCPSTPKQRHFLELCKASKLYLFELPRLIYSRNGDDFADHPSGEELRRLIEFTQQYAECRDQLKRELAGKSKTTSSLDLVSLPSGNALVLSKLYKDISRPHGPVFLVQQGVSQEIRNPCLDNPEVTLDEVAKQKKTAVALDSLLTALHTLSSMQGERTIAPLLQGVVAQLGFSGPGIRYLGLMLSLSNCTLNASNQKGNAGVTTEIHDISPDKIVIVYKGSAEIRSMSNNDVPLGMINYSAPLTLERIDGDWVDTSLDFHAEESVTLYDHDTLFTRAEFL